MSKYKVGDSVVLTESGINNWGECDRNPPNTRGFVRKLDGRWIYVSWDNGTKNIYFETDLAHYGQTLAELNVKAGDVVEMLTCDGPDWVGSICDIDGHGRAVARNGGIFTSKYDELFERTWRIISRASDTPNWLPCTPDYKPQDNHEVTYHMGVPTHYYVEGAAAKSCLARVYWDGYKANSGLCVTTNATLRGKTKDGKPVGQWTIDMDKA